MGTMIFDAALFALGLPLVLMTSYLALLAVAARRREKAHGFVRSADRPAFDVIVPSHNEAAVIEGTVRNLLALDYPRAKFRVVVIADNCTDATAAIAQAAGAVVWTRTAAHERGKGHALRFAFDRSLKEGFADAVVVIDADSRADKHLLSAFAERLRRGELALQAFDGVLNETASWRTQLMAVAMSIFNGMRSLARERLGLSAGLMGNGMCFATKLLRAQRYDAFGLAEDLEYALRLASANVRVGYVAEAEVRAEMPTGGKASSTQRLRWEEGRRAVTRAFLMPMLRKAVRERSAVAFDMAMNLLVPPLSKLAAACLLGLVASAALSAVTLQPSYALPLYAVSSLIVVFYVLRGWALSGTGARGLTALLRAPMYMAWKAWLALHRRSPEGWVRTARGEGAAS